MLGSALYSDRSQIAIRMLTYGERVADAALIASRIASAIAFRESLAIDATAYRLVHGEADLLPSLVVDRYGDYLVVQALSQGMDRLVPVVVETLSALLRPKGILARNDPKARVLDGLPQEIAALFVHLTQDTHRKPRPRERLAADDVLIDPERVADRADLILKKFL